MKKWIGLLLIVVLAVSITACSSKARESKEEKLETQPKAEAITSINSENTVTTITDIENQESSETTDPENKEIVPSLEELMEKSSEAIKQLKSYAMETTSVHNLSAHNYDRSQKELSSLVIKEEHSLDPFKIHTIITTKVGDDNQEYENYLTNDGMYELEDDEWYHIINDSTSELITINKSSNTLSDQLIRINLILDQTKLTVEENNYILTSDVHGDKIKELAMTLLNMGSDEEEIVQQALDQMYFKSLKLTTKFAKDTLIPISTDAQITRYFKVKGRMVFVDSETNIKFNRFNEVIIKVPREALESAIWE